MGGGCREALIIGPTGTVGKVLCDAVGYKARFMLTLCDPGRVPAGFASVPFDLTGPQTYAAALDGVSRLFLLFPPQLGERNKRVAEPTGCGHY